MRPVFQGSSSPLYKRHNLSVCFETDASCALRVVHFLFIFLFFCFFAFSLSPFLLLLLLGSSRSGSVRFREMLYVERWETATEKRLKASKGNLSIAWQQVGGNQRGWIPRSIQRLPVCEAASLRCFYSTSVTEQKRAPEERETIHACLRAHQYTGESFMHEERRNSWMFFRERLPIENSLLIVRVSRERAKFHWSSGEDGFY